MPPNSYERLDERIVNLEKQSEEHDEAIRGKEGLNVRMDRAERVLVLVTKPIVWVAVTVFGAGLTVLVTVYVMRAVSETKP